MGTMGMFYRYRSLIVACVGSLAFGCGNEPTPAGTELARIDTAAETKKRYPGKLVEKKKVEVVFEACKQGTGGPPPAELSSSFKIVSNEKADEFFVQDVVLTVADAGGWTITGTGGTTISMGSRSGEPVFYQDVSTRINCVRREGPLGGAEVGQPVWARADGTAGAH